MEKKVDAEEKAPPAREEKPTEPVPAPLPDSKKIQYTPEEQKA